MRRASTNIKIMAGTAISTLVAGCGVIPLAGEQEEEEDRRRDEEYRLIIQARGMAVNSGTGAVVVTDRTRTGVTVEVTPQPAGGTPTGADVEPKGTMTGGTVIGDARLGMKVVPGTEASNFPSYRTESGDAFLQFTEITPEMAAWQYRIQTSPGAYTQLLGLAGKPTETMPATGSATFTGAATLEMAGGIGLSRATGATKLDADFTPGGGTVSGRISGITLGVGGSNPFTPQPGGRALGVDLLLNPAPIAGNTYSGGTVGIVTAGTDTGVGTVVSSDYGGGFYGAGASQTGGSFHLQATGVPTSLMQMDIEAIGAIYGLR